MRKLFCLFLLFVSTASVLYAQKVIRVAVGEGDMTAKIRAAIAMAKDYKGKPVVIELDNANYHIYRKSSTEKVYYISNTTSESENPDPTKHIGLWLKGLKNVTIEGNGAHIITHGEMTTFLLDSCENIHLKNFTIKAADPTVPELTVAAVGDNYMDVHIHPQSKYTIEDGSFAFVGESWSLSDGIAQAYDARRDITWRSWCPLSGLRRAVELEQGLLRFEYDEKPEASAGMVFQMRDSYRDEACGLILYSKDVLLENIHLAFLGNFGIVGQVSENITYRHLTFEPEAGSGRTCAGFADFVQMSGCKGRITIEDSRFSGAHDDPINVHGTHLSVIAFPAPDKVLLRYMHPQTFGFQSFFAGNEVEFIDPHTLLPLAAFKVRNAEMKSEREILLTLNRAVRQELSELKELVVENVSYTPEVVIRNNYFSRVPTRGILVTTRRKVLIENNTFFRMQMSGVLIADDARSWFESGMVRNVTIKGNSFIECNEPVILISPENDVNGGFVHRNITIDGNRFQLIGTDAVSAKSVDGLSIKNNLFLTPKSVAVEQLISTRECRNVTVTGNIVE